jgi:hypothetical protein
MHPPGPFVKRFLPSWPQKLCGQAPETMLTKTLISELSSTPEMTKCRGCFAVSGYLLRLQLFACLLNDRL